MMRRSSLRITLVGALLLAGGVMWLWRASWSASPSHAGTHSQTGSPAARPAVAPVAGDSARGSDIAASATPAPRSSEPRSELVDGLNDSRRTIDSDLRLLNEVFSAWLTHFRDAGVPIGDNREVTAALTGANSLGYAFVPTDHPALNARGELCDRWGTPFRFHVLSRMQMEIRSAGPDRRFGTADDAEWAPWPRNF